MHKNGKNQEYFDICLLWGHFGHAQKVQKNSTNIYRIKLNLFELDFMGNAFQFEHNFGIWHFLQNKRD